MPVVFRDSDQIWNKANNLEDTKCLIPNCFYATMYEECISCYKTHAHFDVSIMNSLSTVDLMTPK